MADPAYIDVDGVLTDGEAWVAVASTTLGSDAATVTFTSTDDGQVGDWSQYMDLVLLTYARTAMSSTSSSTVARFSNDGTSSYDMQQFYVAAAATSAASSPTYTYTSWCPGSTAGANYFGIGNLHIFDINSGKYKTTMLRSGDDRGGTGYTLAIAGTWKSQGPITEIDIFEPNGSNLVTGSRFDLFGILPRMVS